MRLEGEDDVLRVDYDSPDDCSELFKVRWVAGLESYHY